MSYLLQILGRGLLGRAADAFEHQLAAGSEDITDLEARRKLTPTSYDLAMRLGSAYLHDARISDAQRVFTDALHMQTPPQTAQLGLACVKQELGAYDEALHFLHHAAEQDERDPAIRFSMGLCHEQAGRFSEADRAYREAVRLCPQLRNAHERRAALALAQGDLEGALAAYEALRDLEPGDLNVLLTVATLHLNLRDIDAAIDGYQRAVLIEPESSGDGPTLPHNYDDNEELTQAIADTEQLIAQYPGVTEFHVHLGDLFVQCGNDQGAIAAYHAALELHPNLLEATVKLGTQHMRRARFDLAARQFNQAVDLNDRLLLAFCGLAVAQLESANGDAEANASFDLAASLLPNSVLLFAETNRLQIRGEGLPCGLRLHADETTEHELLLREAVRRHQQALTEMPNNAELHYHIGVLVQHLGNLQHAARSYAQATTIHPKFVSARLKLALALRELPEESDWKQPAQGALWLCDDDLEPHYQLALLFARPLEFEERLASFGPVQDNPHADGEFRQNLRLALQGVGMVDAAGAAWQSLEELSRDEELTYRSSCLPV